MLVQHEVYFKVVHRRSPLVLFVVLLSRLSAQLMRSILAEQAAKEMVKVFDGIPLLLRYAYVWYSYPRRNCQA